MSNVSVNRCSVAHLTEQRSGQTSGCLVAFLARASVDTTDRLKAGAVQIDEEREIARMEIVKNVPIPY
ncbi:MULTISPECIES: hypothetical protein [Ralstonia]|uniref:hypothetical protein n=1 Tax=Ralstonia TaxID=48736 RepID=UPI0015FBE090|nr:MULTISPECIES: hypothetical protein [Ralstonia]MBB0025655.1 hypothetical protein [Ralstonia pickettii]MBB0036283.1 hypothetical protein [Ralstonia pickettii]MBB0098983.1 hypothetical protein [Ralstonia pickettii]MBB0108660.1 hypothetical protein [Ralstonia pickettii]MBB0129757.1 hypothetical protein [Ralstonia pickettii]